MPPRYGWLRLLASPTSALLTAALVATVVVKGRMLWHVDGLESWPAAWAWSAAEDIWLLMGFSALFALGEARSSRLAAATYPLTAMICLLSFINAGYLSIAGQQVTWEAIELGLSRFGDVLLIGSKSVSALTIALVATALIGVPVGIRLILARTGHSLQRRPAGLARAHCAATVALVGLVLALVVPRPSPLAAQQIGGSAIPNTYWQWVTAVPKQDQDKTQGMQLGASFKGFDPPHLVRADDIAALRARTDRPNIILFVLESTRWDHTSLASKEQSRGTSTPTLLALAQGGTSALQARAVLPHTTKSLFSMLCARLPFMQHRLVELSTRLGVQCLPQVLTQAGYRTAFFQSAIGIFEDRARFVRNLGFEFFVSWEDIGGELLGYLASDDMSLVDPVVDWIGRGAQENAPFFATILTSASHHPYLLPKQVRHSPNAGDEQRYGLTIERMDQLMGRILSVLEQRGLRKRTIIIALGDHGEGFGDKGVRQHDTNFYDEGLHVPLVFNGPGVPVRQIPESTSLADLTPSILSLLDVPLAKDVQDQLAGLSLFDGPLPPRALPFSCWHELRCFGFVQGHDKVVFIPDQNKTYHFDLAADPMEQKPAALPPRLEETLSRVDKLLAAHRSYTLPLVFDPVRGYGQWRCDKGKPCVHPNRAQPK